MNDIVGKVSSQFSKEDFQFRFPQKNFSDEDPQFAQLLFKVFDYIDSYNYKPKVFQGLLREFTSGTK